MLTRALTKSLLAIALLPVLATPVLAHPIWFPSHQEGYKLWLSEFDEAESEDYDAAGLINITAYDQLRNIIPTTIISQPTPISVIPQGEIAALIASYDQGFWVRDDSEGVDVDHEPDEYLGYLSEDEQSAIGYENIVRQLKFTKALYNWSDSLQPPFGLPLEVVALTNPFSLKAGDQLPVQILFQGQAVNEAEVEYAGEEFQLDDQGIAYLPIGVEGLQPLEVVYSTQGTANSAITYYTTSFTVQTEPVPEPITVLGALSAVGFATAFKRNKCKGRV